MSQDASAIQNLSEQGGVSFKVAAARRRHIINAQGSNSNHVFAPWWQGCGQANPKAAFWRIEIEDFKPL
ncbi:MAG: hypothetical protein C1O27_002624 [Chloroflexi bacterium]|jgi:hypothetical protein|nr:MAG: hypothetical protein C1O27_002624 [Chloroflexota bacterium]